MSIGKEVRAIVKRGWEKRTADYLLYLKGEERSQATVDKYRRDLAAFSVFLRGRGILDKAAVIAYKEHLTEHYAPASVNSILAAINGFLSFAGAAECRVKPLKAQRRIFCTRERELTKAEYLRLLSAAGQEKGSRLSLVMEAICATGIRVSELPFITAEAVRKGRAEVRCKGKSRVIFLPRKLCRKLEEYLRRARRRSGPVFVTRSGAPLNRSNIWHEMKALCQRAGVPPSKVFPHNLRHLFARTYYSLEKDLGRLADLLGHSSVETTRIYTITTGAEHEKQVAALGLVM